MLSKRCLRTRPRTPAKCTMPSLRGHLVAGSARTKIDCSHCADCAIGYSAGEMGTSLTNRFACLTYHRVGDRDDQYTVSEAQFCAQMSFLQTEGYTVEGFKELHHRLQSKQGFPDRYVVLTLDDGHSSAMVAAN